MLMNAAVLQLAFSRDSEILASGDKDGKIKVIPCCSCFILPIEMISLHSHDSRGCFCESRSPSRRCGSSRLVSASAASTPHTRSASRRCPSPRTIPSSSPRHLTGLFGWQALRTIPNSSSRSIHGLKSGKTLKEFRGHASFVNSAFFTADSQQIVSASSDGTVKVSYCVTVPHTMSGCSSGASRRASVSARTSLRCWAPPTASPSTGLPAQHCTHFITHMQRDTAAPRRGPVSGVQPLQHAVHSQRQGPGSHTQRPLRRMVTAAQVTKSLSSGKRTEGSFVACTVSPKGQWVYAVAEDHILYCFNLASGNLEQTLTVRACGGMDGPDDGRFTNGRASAWRTIPTTTCWPPTPTTACSISGSPSHRAHALLAIA